MQQEPDSFQDYKKQLQEQLGISSLPSPLRPMNAYMRYSLERTSQAKSKGPINIAKLTAQIAQQWKQLPPDKKDFYQQISEIRMRQRKSLFAEFQLLSNKRKVLTPYSRFIKKRYLQYSKEYRNLSNLQITKLVNQDWKQLPLKQKQKLKAEFDSEKNDSELITDQTQQINDYLERLNRYHETIKLDKQKILKKYGVTSQMIAQNKKLKQLELCEILEEERIKYKKGEKKKYRDKLTANKEKKQAQLLQARQGQRQEQISALKAERIRLKKQKQFRKEQKEIMRQLGITQKPKLNPIILVKQKIQDEKIDLSQYLDYVQDNSPKTKQIAKQKKASKVSYSRVRRQKNSRRSIKDKHKQKKI